MTEKMSILGVGSDHVKLRAEAAVNGKLCTVFVEAPREMWDNSLTEMRPDLGRERVEAVLRERLALEVAKHLDVTISEERPVSSEEKNA